MKTIKKSTFTPRGVEAYPALWNEKKKTFIPIKTMKGTELHEVLDSVTLAVEAGAVRPYNWPQQFFASKKAFSEFIEVLAGYDQSFRIIDRWWNSLAMLCEHESDEEGFITTQEMAGELVLYCEENGLLNWSQSRKPKYSEKQYHAALHNAHFDNSLPSDVRFHESSELDAKRRSFDGVIGYCQRFLDYPDLTKEQKKLAQAEDMKYAEKKVTPAKKTGAKRK